MGRFRDRIILQGSTKATGDLRDTKAWEDYKMLKCRKTNLSPQGQAEYHQTLNSDFTTVLEFPGHQEFKIGKHRFRTVAENGEDPVIYNIIEPPKFMGGMTKRTRIAVEEAET